jgi:hypothetical protein
MNPQNADGRACNAAGAMDEGETAKTREGASDRSIGAPRDAGRHSQVFAWRKAVVVSDLTSTQKLVALVLSLHMNTNGGSCFPSQETIAAEASLKERAVRDALKALDRAGFIRREGGRYRGDVTRYTASLPIERRQEVPPSQAGRRQDVPPSSGSKAASDDAEGGTSFHERRHDVPTRTSGGRPKDVLRTNDAARDARSISTWLVRDRLTGEVRSRTRDEAEARREVATEPFADLEVVREDAA